MTPLQGPMPLVVAPRATPAAADPLAAMRTAVEEPTGGVDLRRLVERSHRIAVSVCDVTRAQPRRTMLAVLMDVIDSVRPQAEVVVLVATGTHRASTGSELVEMFGKELLARVKVIDHDARDPASQVDLGVHGDGVPLWLNRYWVEADLRITTGFVEPHFFAGFSGGPKMVAPGLAGLPTVMVLHDARRIGDARATWGVVEDNPVHADIRACARAAPPDFSFDVVLNPAKQLTHAFAGELFDMHRAACEQAMAQAMQPVDRLFEIVVTTGSGYPLDQNFYQAVKGLAAAERVVRPGGTIVLAAECIDGLPDHGSFAELLAAAPTGEALLDMINAPGFAVPDQWQVQVLARVLAKTTVKLYTTGLTAEQVRRTHAEPVDDVERTVAVELARRPQGARVCYLPEGPQTIPYLVA